jgi:hypothetical protein
VAGSDGIGPGFVTGIGYPRDEGVAGVVAGLLLYGPVEMQDGFGERGARGGRSDGQ